MFEESEGNAFVDTRPLIRQKNSDIIHNSLHRGIESHSVDVIKELKKSARNLKKVDLIKTRSKVEYSKYEYTSQPAFLWQEEFVAAFYFFVTMLGYIDKMINVEKEVIDFNSDFVVIDEISKKDTHKAKISEAEEKINKYKRDRQEVLDGYFSILKDESEELIDEVLTSCPSYDKFMDLYKDSEKHRVQLYLPQHLITAYNNGYVYDTQKYEKVLSKYRNLYSELVIYKESNKILVEGVKNKIKTK